MSYVPLKASKGFFSLPFTKMGGDSSDSTIWRDKGTNILYQNKLKSSMGKSLYFSQKKTPFVQCYELLLHGYLDHTGLVAKLGGFLLDQKYKVGQSAFFVE